MGWLYVGGKYEHLPLRLLQPPRRARVLVARAVQDERFKDLKDVYSNAQMSGRMVREVCKLTPEGLILLKTAMERLQLSARVYDRILKVARTAADLAGSADIRIEDFPPVEP